jgi:hypothetical protein
MVDPPLLEGVLSLNLTEKRATERNKLHLEGLYFYNNNNNIKSQHKKYISMISEKKKKTSK